VIVGIAGIVLNGALEIVGRRLRVVAAPGGDDSQIVVDLGQRQARGDELKGAFGFGEVSVSVGGETKIEIGFACYGEDCGTWPKRGDRRFVRALRVVGLAQFQPSLA
jgi:hypothetical protein